MKEHWIVYRDVAEYPRKTFERINAPMAGDRLIKEQVIPGAFGFPPVYIRHHHVHVGDEVVNLITYTETELSEEQVAALAREWVREVDHGNTL